MNEIYEMNQALAIRSGRSPGSWRYRGTRVRRYLQSPRGHAVEGAATAEGSKLDSYTEYIDGRMVDHRLGKLRGAAPGVDRLGL